jgi:hypothetical protein
MPDGAARVGAGGLYGEFPTPSAGIGEAALGPMDAVCINAFGEVWVICDEEDMSSRAASFCEWRGQFDLIGQPKMAQDDA